MPAISQISTSVAQGSAPQLAVNGDLYNFYLCPDFNPNFAQTRVIYKPTPDNLDEYVYDECYPVMLLIIEQY